MTPNKIFEPVSIGRIEAITGNAVVDYQSVQGGYTPAKRLVVTLANGETCFVKMATNALTAGWLRQEKFVYDSLTGPFMPQFLGWDDDGEQPMLLLENLRHAFWPPPWDDGRIDQVVDTLAHVAGCRGSDLPRLADNRGLTDGWQTVALDPAPFLSLGLASEAWLNQTLTTLLDINCGSFLDGTDLVHLDIRSDNLCFDGDRVVIIDWNWACLGNAQFDLGAWLPSLEIEDGPPPEQILPDAGEIAAIISGYFAANAGLPPVPGAPRLRQVQLAQLKSALPWTARALDLPSLDGKIWSNS